MTGLPGPTQPLPMRLRDGGLNRDLMHLAAAIGHPDITIGAHRDASRFAPVEDRVAHLAPYLSSAAPGRLGIGRFCQIAHRLRIITASANHPMQAISPHPLAIFDHTKLVDDRDRIGGLPDTLIGHDCCLGDGVILGAGGGRHDPRCHHSRGQSGPGAASAFRGCQHRAAEGAGVAGLAGRPDRAGHRRTRQGRSGCVGAPRAITS